MEEEKIKKIAELREILEERTRSLETELDGMRALLDLVNDLLIEKSFKRVEEIAKPVAPKPTEIKPQPSLVEAPLSEKRARVIPMKTGTGEPLATFYIENGFIRIVPALDKKFNINTPPFTAFLIEKILAKMRERDQELVKEGRITSTKAFSYEIKKDGDILLELLLKNFSPQRERELKSATLWTLEKMYEKMKSPT